MPDIIRHYLLPNSTALKLLITVLITNCLQEIIEFWYLWFTRKLIFSRGVLSYGYYYKYLGR